MGRHKKIESLPEKKKKRVYRVMKDQQWRDFGSQEEARKHLIVCLESGVITFCSLQYVEVEDC